MSIDKPSKISADLRFDSFENGRVLFNKKKNRLPAMGWNSWNAFGSGNTQFLTKQMADCIVNLGLDKLGYKYVVLDDGCYKSERIDGKLSNEDVKFPDGFKELAKYIHERGLKFGMYNDIGTNLCAGAAVGTCGHEKIDAKSYIDWGIDFLKVDNCYYLWDNATFSNPENARFVYAPAIKSICIKNNKFEKKLTAKENGKLVGQGAVFQNDYVIGIGTFDGTNTGTSPIGLRSSELTFEVDIPTAADYEVIVEYASGRENLIGNWLQLAVQTPDKSTQYFYDDLLPETESKESFKNSNPIKIRLESGINTIRIMNHRRQENTLDSYATMLKALNDAKPDNDIILSLCEWGKTQPQNWGYKTGDSWRILNDITFCVGSDGNPGIGEWNNPGTQSVCSQYNKAVIMDEFSGLEKGWNDPDMLMIGMNGLNLSMNKSHFAMWCMMNAPLMLGMDLRRLTIDDEYYKIIANKDLISLNQDALGIQAKRIWTSLNVTDPSCEYITDDNRFDLLAKPLSDGSVAVALFNLDDKNETESIAFTFEFIAEKLCKKCPKEFKNANRFTVKNLWNGTFFEAKEKLVFDAIEPCGNLVFKITPVL